MSDWVRNGTAGEPVGTKEGGGGPGGGVVVRREGRRVGEIEVPTPHPRSRALACFGRPRDGNLLFRSLWTGNKLPSSLLYPPLCCLAHSKCSKLSLLYKFALITMPLLNVFPSPCRLPISPATSAVHIPKLTGACAPCPITTDTLCETNLVDSAPPFQRVRPRFMPIPSADSLLLSPQ